MEIVSPDFDDGGRIPDRFTCSGDDRSPALMLADVPDDTRSFAIVVDDPDAPRGTFVHWLIWNVPADRTEIPEGVALGDEAVDGLGGAVQGMNGFGEIGYRGPCPPAGGPHHYRFHAYALETVLDIDPGSDRETLENALDGHVIEEAVTTGLFGRGR